MSVTPRLAGRVSEPIRQRPQILSEVELLRRDLGIEMDEVERLEARTQTLQRRLQEAQALIAKQAAIIDQLRNSMSVPAIADPAIGPVAPGQYRYQIGRLTLDLNMRVMSCDHRSVPVSRKEIAFMAHLAERLNTVITTPVLAISLGGSQSGACIRQYKKRLDQKLALIGAHGFLNSRRGWGGGGYWLTNPDQMGGHP